MKEEKLYVIFDGKTRTNIAASPDTNVVVTAATGGGGGGGGGGGN